MFEPMIRAFVSGLSFFNTAFIEVAEVPQYRAPHSAPCPFTTPCGTPIMALEQIGLGPLGLTSSWYVLVTADASQSIQLGVKVEAEVLYARAVGSGGIYDLNLDGRVNPCDLNLDGQFNVNDFMAFLNHPYDYSGDCQFNVLDFLAVQNSCGGG